jgi:ADP-heptose:LPS heptosyltransferase
LFFGMDSGVSHIASCTPIPQVVCYSFINPEWRRPLNKHNFKGITASCPTPFCAESKKILDNNEFRGVSCEYQMCGQDIRTFQILDSIDILINQ